jgi:DNA-binding MarR family transcriptional regulator
MKPSEPLPAEPIDSEALRMVGTMLRLVRAIGRAYAEASGGDLTLPDISVLSLVLNGIDLPSLVARELRLDPPRVTRITDHLVELGLVSREDDPEDRRRSRLRVTDSGQSRLREALALVSSAVDSFLDEIKPEQRAALIDSMDAVRAVLKHSS